MVANLKALFKLISLKYFIYYLLLGLLSGFLTFAFVGLVSQIISLHISGEIQGKSMDYLVVFGLVILLGIVTRRALSVGIIKLSQKLFWQIRMDIITQVLMTTWENLATTKKDLHAAIISDVNVLTQASLSIIGFATSFLLVVMCNCYLLSISLRLWAITFITTIIGSMIYQNGSKANIRNFEKARDIENFFGKHYNAILNGFKEISINPKKGRQIFEENIKAAADESVDLNVNAFTGFLNNQIIGQTLFYVLLAGTLTHMGVVLSVPTSDIVSFGFVLLYLLGAVEGVMVQIPTFSRAQIAFQHLKVVEIKLKRSRDNNKIYEKRWPQERFESIRVDELEFCFTDSRNKFVVGPLDFQISRSEVVFVFGGNGSGKTTFIYILLGLLTPQRGEIFLNGLLLDKDEIHTLGSYVTAVFSDFYLFERILGVDHLDTDRCSRYLDLFDMTGYVTIDDGKFSTQDLSTGQRKRLALIGALLEGRELLILDEWAADQDPYFRKKFYLQILPILREEGFTIIAITHDDKYYGVADRCYKMDFGKFSEVNVASEF